MRSFNTSIALTSADVQFHSMVIVQGVVTE